MKKFPLLCCAAIFFAGCSMLPKSSDTETPQYCTSMGELYYDADVFDQNVKMAEDWYLRAAKKQYPQAMYELGSLYKHNYMYTGSVRDIRRSFKWLEDAADKNYAEAVTSIVEYELMFDTEALKKSEQEEYYRGRQVSQLNQLKEWADKGNAMAKFGVARIYAYKNGGAYHSEALNLLKASAEENYLPAAFYYAQLNKDSDDMVNALIQMADEKRYQAFAYAKLNELAAEGEFTFSDLPEKNQQLCSLFSPRYRFHYNKKNLTPDAMNRIRETWVIAANKGYWGAQVSLAEEYLTGGLLFAQDSVEGYKWFIIARKQWQNAFMNEDAVEVINKLSVEEKSEAIQQAKAWWQENKGLYHASE